MAQADCLIVAYRNHHSRAHTMSCPGEGHTGNQFAGQVGGSQPADRPVSSSGSVERSFFDSG